MGRVQHALRGSTKTPLETQHAQTVELAHILIQEPPAVQPVVVAIIIRLHQEPPLAICVLQVSIHGAPLRYQQHLSRAPRVRLVITRTYKDQIRTLCFRTRTEKLH